MVITSIYIGNALKKLKDKVKASGDERIVDSKQESANGDYMEFAKNVSDHFPVTLVIKP